MKTRQLIAAVFALSAIATVGSTFADRPSDGAAAMSAKTRAEVQAEFEKARAEGLLMNSGERGYYNEWSRPGAQGVAGSRYSARTREEVKAEAIEHVKNYKFHPEDR